MRHIFCFIIAAHILLYYCLEECCVLWYTVIKMQLRKEAVWMALDNRLGITDSAALAREEERISKRNAVGLFESGALDQLTAGTFSALCAIHKALFADIYDFAGALRTVNIAKGHFRFAPVMYLQSAVENVEKMPQSTFDEIVEKYVEMNVAHPFREGNGRATRIWLDLMLKKELGVVVDWSRIDKEDYLPFALCNVRDNSLESLLKLTAELCASHKASHIERQKPLILEAFRNISRRDTTSQALHNRGLSNTWLTDKNRIVFCAAAQNLHNSSYLLVAPDNRVNLVLSSLCGEVNSVFLECVRLALWVLAIDL